MGYLYYVDVKGNFYLRNFYPTGKIVSQITHLTSVTYSRDKIKRLNKEQNEVYPKIEQALRLRILGFDTLSMACP